MRSLLSLELEDYVTVVWVSNLLSAVIKCSLNVAPSSCVAFFSNLCLEAGCTVATVLSSHQSGLGLILS